MISYYYDDVKLYESNTSLTFKSNYSYLKSNYYYVSCN